MSSSPVAHNFLSSALRTARQYKDLAEKALAQVDDEGFFAPLDEDSNSLAVLVKHLGGNLRSRWRDFLTADGEKPDRNRDGEFLIGPDDSREALMALWEEGWEEILSSLFNLAPEDLGSKVRIRSQPLGVIDALHRSLTHLAYHVGQIVQLARHFRREDWQSLSIPRGQSEQFTRRLEQEQAEKQG